jgi:hypothetical protein
MRTLSLVRRACIVFHVHVRRPGADESVCKPETDRPSASPGPICPTPAPTWGFTVGCCWRSWAVCGPDADRLRTAEDRFTVAADRIGGTPDRAA